MPSPSENVRNMIQQKQITVEHGETVLRKIYTDERLMHVFKGLHRSPQSYFEPRELEKHFNIKIIPWSYEAVDDKPIFFRQLTDAEFQADYNVPAFHISQCKSSYEYCHAVYRTLGTNIGETWHRRENNSLRKCSGLQTELQDDGHPQIMLEYAELGNPVNRYEWVADGIYGYAGKPHTIITSYHICEASSPNILRSEIIIILRAMRWKSRRKAYLDHDIVPVLLISLRPTHFRVIEAYFDGKMIQIRYSNPVGMKSDTPERQQQERMDWILRWIGSKPQGYTRSYNSLKQKTQDLPTRSRDHTPSRSHRESPKQDPKGKGKERSSGGIFGLKKH